MGEWKRVKLGEICSKIGSGATPTGGKSAYKDNGVSLIRSQNVLDMSFTMAGLAHIDDEQARKLDGVTVCGGDVLLNITGDSVARCCIVPNHVLPARVNQHVCIVRPRLDLAESRFVEYFLVAIKDRLLTLASAGATRNALTKETIQNLEVDLPPLPTQRRIAAVLGALDDKIEVNRKICENLEAQAQALFKAWFVDFEPFGGKRPEGWKMGKLGDIGEIIGGATPSKAKSEYYTDDGIAWITPKDISLQGTKFIAKGEIDITEKGFKSASVKLMSRGSVLFSSRAPIGYVAIARSDICTNQGFKSVVPKDGVGTCFVYEFLKLNKRLIEDRASGSTFKEISTAGMRDIPIMIPDAESLKRFETSAWPLFLTQENKESESRALAAMRDALLPKLMSGELSVEKVEVMTKFEEEDGKIRVSTTRA